MKDLLQYCPHSAGQGSYRPTELGFLPVQKAFLILLKNILMYHSVPVNNNLLNFALGTYIFGCTSLNRPKYRPTHGVTLGNSLDIKMYTKINFYQNLQVSTYNKLINNFSPFNEGAYECQTVVCLTQKIDPNPSFGHW